MLARLLTRTRLSLPDQRIRAGGYAALRPRNGLTVQVEELDGNSPDFPMNRTGLAFSLEI